MMASLMLRRIVVQSTRVVASAMRTTALPTMCPVATPLIMSRSIATRTLKSITAKPKRAFKNPRYKLKSKQCAVKRFIVMGGGRLKRGHSGKVFDDFTYVYIHNLYSDI